MDTWCGCAKRNKQQFFWGDQLKDYQSGGQEFLYPDAGDEAPSKGAKVNVLTIGGISTTSDWDPSFCIGWYPLNNRDRKKEEIVRKVRHEKGLRNI